MNHHTVAFVVMSAILSLLLLGGGGHDRKCALLWAPILMVALWGVAWIVVKTLGMY